MRTLMGSRPQSSAYNRFGSDEDTEEKEEAVKKLRGRNKASRRPTSTGKGIPTGLTGRNKKQKERDSVIEEVKAAKNKKRLVPRRYVEEGVNPSTLPTASDVGRGAKRAKFMKGMTGKTPPTKKVLEKVLKKTTAPRMTGAAPTNLKEQARLKAIADKQRAMPKNRSTSDRLNPKMSQTKYTDGLKNTAKIASGKSTRGDVFEQLPKMSQTEYTDGLKNTAKIASAGSRVGGTRGPTRGGSPPKPRVNAMGPTPNAMRTSKDFVKEAIGQGVKMPDTSPKGSEALIGDNKVGSANNKVKADKKTGKKVAGKKTTTKKVEPKKKSFRQRRLERLKKRAANEDTSEGRKRRLKRRIGRVEGRIEDNKKKEAKKKPKKVMGGGMVTAKKPYKHGGEVKGYAVGGMKKRRGAGIESKGTRPCQMR